MYMPYSKNRLRKSEYDDLKKEIVSKFRKKIFKEKKDKKVLPGSDLMIKKKKRRTGGKGKNAGMFNIRKTPAYVKKKEKTFFDEVKDAGKSAFSQTIKKTGSKLFDDLVDKII